MEESHVEQETNDSTAAVAVQFLQDACGVSQTRANQLLEATSGSVERAVELCLADQTASTTSTVAAAPQSHSQQSEAGAMKRKLASGSAAATVAAAQSPVSSPPPKRRQQATLASFFAKNKSGDKDIGNSNNTRMSERASAKLDNCGQINETTNKRALLDKKTKKRRSFSSSMKPQTDSKIAATSPLKVSTATATNSEDCDDPRLHYAALAKAFSTMVATTKRNAKLDALESVLTDIVHALGGIGDSTDRSAHGMILCRALLLILGRTNSGGVMLSGTASSSSSSSSPLQVSGSAVSKAVVAVIGLSSSTKLKEAYRRTGDLGDAAEQFRRNQQLLVPPRPLTIVGVYNVLEQIAAQEGTGSQAEKHALMVKLLRSCKSLELKFLVRTLLGNMRIGANVKTVLAALATTVEKEDAAQSGRAVDLAAAIHALQGTFDFCPRLDKLSYALLCGGVARMQETCVMEVGTVINPMLANPAHSWDEVQTLMTSSTVNGTFSRTAVAEWKYDGMRCQAHYDGSSVKLFSRHMLETTGQFPDAVKAVLGARRETTTSFVIDAEIVGVEEVIEEPGTLRLLPFQDLATRRGAADAGKESVRISVFAFDIMYLNGESLAKLSLWRRQRALRAQFRETAGFSFAQSLALKTFDETTVREFLQIAVNGGAEGLMVKLTGQESSADGKKGDVPHVTMGNHAAALETLCPYESGVRSQTWLKVKRDYVAGFADTVDVVPIGAWYGNGRKAQKNFLSPVLLAVYDEEEDVYQSISRCMTFTDAMYDAMRDFYLKGIPYPHGVGIVDDSGEGKFTTNAVPFSASQENMSNGDSDDNDGKDEVERFDDETPFVNCYPSRPSSTTIVTNESPPIWFKPMEVFEVSFADLSLSKQHTAAAGLVDPERGVSLRFPRFKRRRPDKCIDQATTASQIAELFGKQTKHGKT